MGIVIDPTGAAVRVQSAPVANIRESITDVARQIEDLNWVNLSTDRPSYDLVYDDRKRYLQRIRLYRRRSPLAKQGANLLQHYVLGQGISLKANNKTLVARIVDEFWEDPVNLAAFTSHQSQKEALDGLFTDGDMFLTLFPNKEDGTVQLGILDALFVEDIITDPENARVAKWYKARKPDTSYSFSSNAWEPRTAGDFTYYRDWRNTDAPGGKGAPKKSDISEGLIYHVRINRRGKFGESELAAALDWLKAHKDFMEDRASLNRAAAQIAWKKKRKGGASDIAQEVQRLQSSLINNVTRYESNPPAVSASTIVENEGSELSWVKTDTGGQSALADERVMRMMAGAGMGGIPNHYFGDEANANLATATSMELPLLKSYEDWQKLWGDVVSDIIQFVLSVAHEAGRIGERDDSRRYSERVSAPKKVLAQSDVADKATSDTKKASATATASLPGPTAMAREVREEAAPPGGNNAKVGDPAVALTLMPKTQPSDVTFNANDETGVIDWFVDVDFPPIIQKDLGVFMTALKTFYEFLPPSNVESQKLIVEMALIVFGQNNVDEVMERLFPFGMAPEPEQTTTPQNPDDLLKAIAAIAGTKAPENPAADLAQQDSAVAESLAEYRVRRVLKAARDASTALARVGA